MSYECKHQFIMQRFYPIKSPRYPKSLSPYNLVLAPAAAPWSVAVVVALVRGVTRHGTGTPADLLCELRGFTRALRATGWRGPLVCLVGGLATGDRAALLSLCTEVLEPPPLPLYAGPGGPEAAEFARQQRRLPPASTARVQRRRDGGATALKLHAWALSKFNHVLLCDVRAATTSGLD